MSLTHETTIELQNLAQAMISERVNTSSYRNFGTLVRKDSEEFGKFENEIVLGEIKVESEEFVFFGK